MDTKSIIKVMQEITGLIDKYLEFISKNNKMDFREFVNGLEDCKFAKLLDPDAADTRIVNTRIWKDYVAKKKYETQFMRAAKIENEKLKEIIRTKDTKKARDILLGKYDKDFEELIRREAR